MSCRRTGLQIVNVFTDGVGVPWAGVLPAYPTLYLMAQTQIPYACGIVGYWLSSAGAMAVGALETYAVFIVASQSAPQLQVSPALDTVGSQLYLMRSTNARGRQQVSSLIFTRSAFYVAANQPIALYGSKEAVSANLNAVLSLYVLPEA